MLRGGYTLHMLKDITPKAVTTNRGMYRRDFVRLPKYSTFEVDPNGLHGPDVGCCGVSFHVGCHSQESPPIYFGRLLGRYRANLPWVPPPVGRPRRETCICSLTVVARGGLLGASMVLCYIYLWFDRRWEGGVRERERERASNKVEHVTAVTKILL